MKYKAIDILNIAHDTFSLAGDAQYTESKSNRFLARCGAIIEDGPNQLLSIEAIKNTACSMFDANLEAVFFEKLKDLEVKNETI